MNLFWLIFGAALIGFGQRLWRWFSSTEKTPPWLNVALVLLGAAIIATHQVWLQFSKDWRALSFYEKRQLKACLEIAKGCAGQAAIWVTSEPNDAGAQLLATDISKALDDAGYPEPAPFTPWAAGNSGLVIVARHGVCVTALQRAIREATGVDVKIALESDNMQVCLVDLPCKPIDIELIVGTYPTRK